MPVVHWDGSLAVGVELIDKQHEDLFRIINSFNDRLETGEDELFSLDVLLDSLKNYVRYHFTTEQNLLERNGCPALARHKGLHDAFAAHVAQYEQGRTHVTRAELLALQEFLLDWLTSHIRDEDLPLKDYFAS